jgi:hypothetical protein
MPRQGLFCDLLICFFEDAATFKVLGDALKCLQIALNLELNHDASLPIRDLKILVKTLDF